MKDKKNKATEMAKKNKGLFGGAARALSGRAAQIERALNGGAPPQMKTVRKKVPGE